MLKDIKSNLDLIEQSISWAKEYGKENFPYDVFKEYRRKIKKINRALEENCSVAAYGESQVGKSYLMSSLLSSPKAPFVITNANVDYSFIDDINPSGGNNSKVESTGVITRFTLQHDSNNMSNYVRVRTLTVVDIILLLVDSYYNDLLINQDTVLKYDDINMSLENMAHLWSSHTVQHSYIEEDDIKDICDYIHDVIGNAATSVNQSGFCRIVGPIIQYIPFERWVDVFSLLWNKNGELSHLFSLLINEYKKLNFETIVYIPFEAVLREKGTILKIEWLDTVCGLAEENRLDEKYTDVYGSDGKLLASKFHKGYLSALIAELTFDLPQELSEERQFLKKFDLLDFPGARSRERYKEQDIKAVLPKILRRGKVAYLFNKYSRTSRISSVLYCHHNDQKTEPRIGDTINTWIEDTIGRTPLERTDMLNRTNGISPLFLIATKFNIDLERAKTDQPSNKEKLCSHWNRFDTILPEIIKPNTWMEDWVVPGGLFQRKEFQNIYPLRDFFWSRKGEIFDGYSDGEEKSEEKNVHVFTDYPDYFENLKESFVNNDFVKRHFSSPEHTWNSVATPNNDGSKEIIKNLDIIASVLSEAREAKYLEQLKVIKNEIYKSLIVYYEPEESDSKNEKIKQIANDIKLALTLSVGSKPETFGRIIDALMIPIGELRDIVYDIIVCHSDMPCDFDTAKFVRIQAGIDVKDGKDINQKKLCDYFGVDIDKLESELAKHNCSVNAVVTNEYETLTTIADVVTKHIVDYWNSYLNGKVKYISTIMPHSEEVVYMLTGLFRKLEVRKIISEKINTYCNLFALSEQPNAIADYASLILNNFVSSVGRNYIEESELESIKVKSDKCQLKIDISEAAWSIKRKPQPLLQTLQAFDDAKDIDNVDKASLEKLPLWDNFQRWQNLVTIGLLYASDISNVDPFANKKIKSIIDKCETLYN